MEGAKFLYFSQLFFLIYLTTSTAAKEKQDESKVYTKYLQLRFVYPYAVALFLDGHYKCGASTLNLKYVVTAAHCLINLGDDYFGTDLEKGRYSVIGGSSYIKEIGENPPTEPFTKYGPGSPIQKRNVTQTFVHRYWSSFYNTTDRFSKNPYIALTADIGVALLKTPFISKPGSIQPIRFFSNVFWRSYIANLQMFRANRTCYGIGWGNAANEQKVYEATKEIPRRPSKNLREVQLRVFDTESCIENDCIVFLGKQCKGEKRIGYMKWLVAQASQQICVFPLTLNFQPMCHGDSGSPLVCDWDPTKQESDERGYVVGHLTNAALCGPMLYKHSSRYLPHVRYYGFFSLFDLSFAGSMEDPFGSSTACNPLWPPSEECLKMRKKIEEGAKSSSGRFTKFATVPVIFSVVSSNYIFV